MFHPIIDAHTHILPDEFRNDPNKALLADDTFRELFSSTVNRTASADLLISEMELADVGMSIVLGYGWTNKDVARVANDYLLDASRNYPGRIVPFCSVNPLWGDSAIYEVERCVSAGARGVGELHFSTQRIDIPSLPRLADFMKCLSMLDIPVVVHASEPVGHTYVGKGETTPRILMALVRKFPENRFVFAHFGGGLPFYSLMPEVRDALANSWFDSAAFPFLFEPRVFSVSAMSAGVKKILFGSDYPLVTQRRALREFRKAGLEKDCEELILASNMAEILRLG